MVSSMRNNQQPVQELYGCYTISDSWTVVRAQVEELETNKPQMTLEFLVSTTTLLN